MPTKQIGLAILLFAAMTAQAAGKNTSAGGNHQTGAGTTNDPACEEVYKAMTESAKQVAQRDQTIFETYITEPESVTVRGCLEQIAGMFTTGFSFFGRGGLFDGLAEQACEFAKSQVSSQLSRLSGGVSLPFGLGGVSVSAGGSNGIQVRATAVPPSVTGAVMRALQ